MGAELHGPLESNKNTPSRRFASVRRGYDPSEVDDFLTSIATRIEALETAMLDRAAERLDRADPASSAEDGSDDGYTERMARLGMVGVREVENMLAEAKVEAAAIVAEARSEADRIKVDAQIEARGSVAEARSFLTKVEQDAAMALSGIQDRRRQMTDELRRTQEHLLSVAQELHDMLKPEAGS